MAEARNSFLQRIGLGASLAFKALATPVAFGVSALAENTQGQVLLVRHSYMAGWQLPGGGVQRGEPPVEAIVRELREEIGLTHSLPPQMAGLFTRRYGLVTNLVALYRVRDIQIAFKPNLEIRDARFFDPRALPGGATASTRRRIAEIYDNAPVSSYW
ncbi:MAG TPA: NUDIX domain-containing protein [Rhizomicrobium sp.]|nr:NUDIX domain-containing protein [Rhizomicrobium sp.]